MNDNLPPLPPEGFVWNDPEYGDIPVAYTYEQMKAYARAALASAPQPQPVAWLVTGPSEKRSFDMQSFAESWCKGLNKGFGEDVYKISNLVVQSSEPHEKCNDERMCAACYSGQGKCKTQPVQQEPVAHFGSAYVNENGVHITTVLGPVAIPQDAKLYTSPQAQAAQPLTVAGGAVFQDAEGKRPVTAIGQPVGRWEPTPLYPPGGAGVFLERPQAQPLSNDASPISVLLAVEESIKNGECPWQIEQAFDEYEAQRQSAITKGTT